MAESTVKRRSALDTIPLVGPLAICIVLYLFPLAAWLISLPATKSQLHVSRIYYAQISGTLWMSLASAALAAGLGGIVACLAVFSQRRFAKALAFLMTMPLLVGFVARNYSWTGLLSHFYIGPLGFVGRLQDSAAGVILVMSVVFTPLAFFIIFQGTMRLRPEYFAAARTLGATDARAFCVIAVPLLLPSAGIAVGTTFVLGLGYFITPQLIGGGNFPFIGNGVLRLLNDLGDVPAASRLALALLLTVLVPVAVAAAVFVIRQGRKKARVAQPVDTREASA